MVRHTVDLFLHVLPDLSDSEVLQLSPQITHLILHHFLIRSIRLQTCRLGQAVYSRVAADLLAFHILAYEAFAFLPNYPTIHLHIDQIDVSAGIRFVAPEHNWEQQTLVHGNILQGHIPDIDARLCLAGPSGVEWVEHAPWASSQRLLLLLRTQVDCPPNGLIDIHVLIVDILDLPAACVAWVRFNVYGLKRFLKVGIPEGYIPDAVMLGVGGHASDREPDTQSNGDVFNQHMFSAVTNCATMAGLGDYDVVIVLHCEIPNVEMLAGWVDSIGVEGKEWDCTLCTEFFGQVELRSCIYLNVQVIDVEVEATHDPHVEHWGVLQCKIMDFEIVAPLDVEHMRT